ncbi:hypothetical protein NDR96_07800 [Stenotrophomonas maltophilia]|nr:hypothetical protein NDR96_07800 [Stenotrophomonas maltophilia]
MDTLVGRRMAAQSVIADSGSYRRSPTNSRMFRLFLLLVCAVPAIAIGAREGHAPEWVREVAADKNLQVDPEMVGVRLEPTARGAFLDTRAHRIGARRFRALYQVFDSNADNPMGLCGAGREIHLFVYEVMPLEPVERGRIRISSCLEALSLASQNSGRPHSESDFSSVIWQGDGITIEWWGIGPGGDASSHYTLRNDHFVPTQSGEGNR